MSNKPVDLVGKSTESGHREIIRIKPRSGWQPIRLGELWDYRDLVWIFALRDVKVRYKQTLLGVAWAVLQPLATMLIFTLFFGRFAKIPSDGVPYALFSFCGLLPWQLFSTSLTVTGNSLVGSQNLISKIYFPRLAIPVSTLLASLLDFSIQLCVLFALFAWYKIPLPGTVLALPFFFVLLICCSLGAGLWLSALNVEYRDVRHAIPFLAQTLLFVTPVIYPSSIVGDNWRWVLGLNPMAGVIEGFRWALLPGVPLHASVIATSVMMSLFLFVTGLFYFRRMEKNFADVI